MRGAADASAPGRVEPAYRARPPAIQSWLYKWQTEQMGTTLALVERRKDGKLWPVGGERSPEELQRAITAVHQLHCRDGLSLRRIVAELAAQHGLRVFCSPLRDRLGVRPLPGSLNRLARVPVPVSRPLGVGGVQRPGQIRQNGG